MSAPIPLSEFRLAIQTLSFESSELEIQRLQNSIKHLVRSNDELLSATKRTSDSAELNIFLETVAENKEVIESQNTRIEILQQHIKDVKDEQAHQDLLDKTEKVNISDSTDPNKDPISKSPHQTEHSHGVIL